MKNLNQTIWTKQEELVEAQEMKDVFKIKPSEAKHFLYNDKEFEIRITDEGDKLEIWEVDYDSSGKCNGFKDIVAEFFLEGVSDVSTSS